MLLIYDKPVPCTSALKLELIAAERNTGFLGNLQSLFDTEAALEVIDVS